MYITYLFINKNKYDTNIYIYNVNDRLREIIKK